MRQLTIYRGEALISRVPLTGKPVRLGRSKDNDVVLEDPGKGVSRNHAELRPEGDRYRLVDLESQNGVWVSGERVPSVLLAPGVVAAMGPFRVAIDAVSSDTQPFTAVPPDVLPDTGTEYSRPSAPPSAGGPAVIPVDGVGSLLDDANPATNPPVAPASPPAGSARRGPPPSSSPPAPQPRRSAAAGTSYAKPAMWAVVALVLIAGSAFAAYTLLNRTPPKPKWDGVFAMNLVNNGRCQEALDQHINPALQADPNNAEARSLKEKCTVPSPTTSIPPPPPAEAKTNAQMLDEADTALAAKECQVALDTANGVLTADPNDTRAKDLVTKATECLNPTPNVVKASPPADPVVRIPPADGGLEPLPGETGKAYKIRVDSVLKRYNDAVTLLQAQRYRQAMRELDAIADTPGVPQGYKEMAQRRGEARNGLREEATRAYAAGQQAEGRAEWNAAIAAYERAHDLDSSRDVTADVARVNVQKVKLGRDACAVAQGKYSLGKNDEAAQNYNKVLELLPSTDPCYAEAKERLSIIRR